MPGLNNEENGELQELQNLVDDTIRTEMFVPAEPLSVVSSSFQGFDAMPMSSWGYNEMPPRGEDVPRNIYQEGERVIVRAFDYGNEFEIVRDNSLIEHKPGFHFYEVQIRRVIDTRAPGVDSRMMGQDSTTTWATLTPEMLRRSYNSLSGGLNSTNASGSNTGIGF